VSDFDVTTATMAFRDGETWYRISNPRSAKPDAAPLLVLHGGPGGPHDYLLPLADLTSDGRAVIHYDQAGVGNSSRRPDWPTSAWTMDLFIDELVQLVDHLGLEGGFHLLGHSWGGMLGVEFALRFPDALRSLTLTDTVASAQLILDSVNAIYAQLEDELEESGAAEHSPRLHALFAERHMCRVPMTEELAYTFAQLGENTVVHRALNGTSNDEFEGNLRGWSAIDRLPGLTVPSLVLTGEFDELTPIAWQPFVDGIPDVRLHVFAGASHVPFIETPAEYFEVLGGFLRDHDGS